MRNTLTNKHGEYYYVDNNALSHWAHAKYSISLSWPKNFLANLIGLKLRRGD